jgi:hypothetical protein
MPKIQRVVAVVVAAYLLLAFLEEFVLVRLLATRLAVPLLLAAFEALAAIGMGFLVRGLRGRVWRFDDPEAKPDLPLDLLIGVPFLGAICFLVGSVLVSTWTMIPLLIVFGLAGAYAVARWFETRTIAVPAPATRMHDFAVTAIVLVFVCAFIAAQAPPSTLDELSYHLAVPWTWVKEGRTVDLPLISHSYFPLGIESADLPPLAILGNLSGGLASHLLHLMVAIAATMVIARRTRDLLVTAAIVATPALAVTAGWSLVDWALVGIAVAFVGAIDDDDNAAIAATLGAGLLTKYTFVPITLLAAVAGLRSLSDARRRWRPIAIGVALGSLFFLRNLILTGNPAAPFFSPTAPHVSAYRVPYLSSYVFDGSYIDESLGASLLGVAVATTGAVGWVMLIAGGVLFVFGPSARILVPFFAVTASRVRSLAESRTLRLILAFAISAQLLLLAYFVERSDAFSIVAARASDEQYLVKVRPSITPIRALDASLPPDSRTLVIGLNETYWFAHRVRGGGNFDGPRLSRYLEAPTPEALYARLKRDGITHIAVMNVPAASSVAKKVEERDAELTAGAQRTLTFTLDHYAANVTAPGSSTTLFALR